MKRIILDTNMLLVPATLGVDLRPEFERICDFKYELCVLQATIDELKGLAQGASRQARAAKLGLQIADTLTIVPRRGYADELLLEEADEDTIIATQDKDLKRKLKARGAPHIILRQKRYLQLVEP